MFGKNYFLILISISLNVLLCTILSHNYKKMFNTGVTKVQPIEISPDNDEDSVTTVTTVSTSVSRVSSARSVVSSVSSMWAGSEQDEGEYDAFIRARKVNLYGQVLILI